MFDRASVRGPEIISVPFVQFKKREKLPWKEQQVFGCILSLTLGNTCLNLIFSMLLLLSSNI